MKLVIKNVKTGEEEVLFEGKITSSEIVKPNQITDTLIHSDVLLLTLLEIMGVERFRLSLCQALSRHKSDSHLKTERKNAEDFLNVLNDLKYLRWQKEDFKM